LAVLSRAPFLSDRPEPIQGVRLGDSQSLPIRSIDGGSDEHCSDLGRSWSKVSRNFALTYDQHAKTSDLLHFAPNKGSFDHSPPSSSGKLHGIELLDPAVGLAGGFRSTHGKKDASQPERGHQEMAP
jgi:hypothetical protein